MRILSNKFPTYTDCKTLFENSPKFRIKVGSQRRDSQMAKASFAQFECEKVV